MAYALYLFKQVQAAIMVYYRIQVWSVSPPSWQQRAAAYLP
ncbi:hypothetical protein SAMN05444682_102112 [Parapedobacter indicus]|uniref:Uncharacterized protein n=1 Tax=Parapedobacter indicus TaxID=1477437 RepID=A0A1I3F0U0_9SPHI|nr:hypothetical protein CLV26_102112 [Parapedobacter indicus]SFI04846.1 hypothetical protein SAMN05444682_102112 [Parapedobacter indicus]